MASDAQVSMVDRLTGCVVSAGWRAQSVETRADGSIVLTVVPITPAPPKECAGFVWIGQSFRYCDRCGQPYWEHKAEERYATGGPFTAEYVYVPITDADAAAVRAKWDR